MRNKILHKSLTAVEILKQVSTKTILTCLALGTFLSFGYTAHADNNTNNPPPAPANFNQTSGAVDISTGTATVTFSVPAGGIECLTGPVTLQLEVDGDFNGNYTGAAGADPCSLGPGICPPSDEEIRITGTGITGTLGYNEDGNSSNGVFSVAAANVPTVATAFACQAVGNTFTYTFSVGTEVDLDAGTAVRVNLSFDYETLEAPILTGTAYTQVGVISGCQPTQADAEAMFSAANALMGYTDPNGGATGCNTTLMATRTGTVVGGTSCDWTVTHTYTISDGCSENDVTGLTYMEMGEDDMAPVFNDPADVALTTNAGAGCPADGVTGLAVGSVASGVSFMVSGVAQTGPTLDATNSSVAAGEYYDACQTASLEVVSISANTGDDCDAVYTIVWRVTDGCGQMTDQDQEFTVEDNTAPIFNDPSDVTETTNGGASCPGSTGVTGIAVGSVTSGVSFMVDGTAQTGPTLDATNSSVAAGAYYDACQTASLEVVSISGNTGDACDAVYTIVWRVTDGCGQMTDQDQVFTIEENTIPVANGSLDPAILTNTGANGAAPAGTAVVVDAGCDVTINVTDLVDNLSLIHISEPTRPY